MQKISVNKKRLIFLVILGSITIFGLIVFLLPYLLIPDIETITHVPWTELGYESPKAAIQFTFTSKVAFTTNYPIHAKVEIWFYRETQNDTNVLVHIVNPPAQAFKHPLSDIPEAGLIEISPSGEPRKGELDLEFTSPGPYGFTVFFGSSPYLGNMTVAYAGQDEEVIRISPPETRFQTEWAIRGIGIALVPISVIIAIFKESKARAPQKKIEIFLKSKEVLRKSSGLLKGHLRHLEEEGNEYHAKGRIPGEIENIIKHSSTLSSIGNGAEKEKIKPILEKGKIYSEFTTTEQFLEFSNEIREWANKANSIQIDLS